MKSIAIGFLIGFVGISVELFLIVLLAVADSIILELPYSAVMGIAWIFGTWMLFIPVAVGITLGLLSGIRG